MRRSGIISYYSRQMISFLVDHSELSPQCLEIEGKLPLEGNTLLEGALKPLIEKFRKVKKSREELVKYVIRKALAFVQDNIWQQRRKSLNFSKYSLEFSKQGKSTNGLSQDLPSIETLQKGPSTKPSSLASSPTNSLRSSINYFWVRVSATQKTS